MESYDREEAIQWCIAAGLGERWVNSTKWQFPNGWRWVVSNRPYQTACFKLVNAKFDEITKEDVK